MQQYQLYQELIDYIYDYHGEFRTKDENIGALALKTGKKINLNPAINEMIANGSDAFKNRVAERIFREHRNELELNLCPKCGKIARTPASMQCRFCYYDWH